MHAELADAGFAWLRGFIDRAETAALGETLEALCRTLPHEEGRAAAGVRIPLAAWTGARELLQRPTLAGPLESALGGPPRLVRVLLFDKSATAVWFVRWHRDTMIPVREHRPGRELTAPSVKAGVPHVRATATVLARMLALRLHLDASTPGNGPLKVLPGSHRIHDLFAPEAALPRDHVAHAVTCLAEPGDLLLMRPLLLHASPKPVDGNRRRVLQLEVSGPQELPGGHDWYEH